MGLIRSWNRKYTISYRKITVECELIFMADDPGTEKRL